MDKKPYVPVAICGYGYRLPGGMNNDEDFWKLMAERGFVQETIEDRYGKDTTPHDLKFAANSPRNVASAYEGLIKEGRELEFDCEAFGMARSEAKRMDPQIKMMLSCTWEALQCAGIDQADLHNSNTGVFVGHQSSAAAAFRAPLGAQSPDVPGRSGSMIANRISFHFNWMGPSYSVATACSSGITAMDNAMKALDCGECDVAVFGAVQYLGHMEASIGFNMLGIISETGTSRCFDKSANGYMRSEGAFIYIIKRLEDAERDGDKIFGVIRGCGLNTAGAEEGAERMTQGRMILSPVGHAQEALMRSVTRNAGVDPLKVDYVEAHATGTPVGDAIEGNSIAKVYGSANRTSDLRLASVRSNMGHLEAASFTSSLLKVLLMIKKKHFLPVSSHFKEHNPKIPFRAKKLEVQTTCEAFPERDEPITFGINSFGFGGANGHCIIQEYRPENDYSWSKLPGDINASKKCYMLPLTAKSEKALAENAKSLLQYIQDGKFNHDSSDEGDSTKDSDILYKLASNHSARMTHFRIRTALTARTVEDLCSALSNFVEAANEDSDKKEVNHVASSFSPQAVMIFPGQGSQWGGCGRELYSSEIVFRRVVDAIDSEWEKLSGGQKLSDVAFSTDESNKEALNTCKWAQPVTFMIQVGLWEMLKVYGVIPTAVVGHSAGEVAAAYASGAYTLEEACMIAYHRSMLQETLAGCGNMLVLMQNKESVQDLLVKYGFDGNDEDDVNTEGSHRLYMACMNSYNNTVVCGARSAIDAFQEKLKGDELPEGKLIPGNIAFHSPLMDPIQESVTEALKSLDSDGPRECKIPLISTVTGSLIKTLDTNYWWRNIREPVDYLGALKIIKNTIQANVLIEASPHITLRSPTRDFYENDDTPLPPYIHSLIRGQDSSKHFAEMIGNCFKIGLDLDFHELYPRPEPVTHLLPPYALKRETVIDELLSEDGIAHKKGVFDDGPLLGKYSQGGGLQYYNIVGKDHYGWLCDHVVQGVALFPAAGYIEVLIEANKGQAIVIDQIRFHTPLVLNEPKYLHTALLPVSTSSNKFSFRITSRTHSGAEVESTLHCSGYVTVSPNHRIPKGVHKNLSEDTMEYAVVQYPDSKSFYDTMNSRTDNFAYGPYFQAVQRVIGDLKTMKLRIEVGIDDDFWQACDKMGYFFHPSMLDGALQAFITFAIESPDYKCVPEKMQRFVYLGKKPSSSRMVVLFDPPTLVNKNNLLTNGQINWGLGECYSGKVYLYDAVTGDLVAYTEDEYIGFSTNDKDSDLLSLKHNMSWQPKTAFNVPELSSLSIEEIENNQDVSGVFGRFIEEMASTGHPSADTPFFVNVGECSLGEMPDNVALEKFAKSLKHMPVQYSVLAPDMSFLKEMYQTVGANDSDAHLRFANSTADFDSGYLRPHMFELFLVSINKNDEDVAELESEAHRLTKLVAPGGLLVLEVSGCEVSAPSSFSCLYDSSESGSTSNSDAKQKRIMVLKSPSIDQLSTEASSEEETELPSVVVFDDNEGYSKHWRMLHKQGEVEQDSELNFEESKDWKEIHYFAMTSEDDADENLHSEAFKVTNWIQRLAAHRDGLAGTEPCLLTVYTCGAVCNVTSPEQTGIWGAIRTISAELREDYAIDFRLVDLACPDDLRFVPIVTSMREREMCIRNGQVWTSRMLNKWEKYPTAGFAWEDKKEAFLLKSSGSGALKDIQYHTIEFSELGARHIRVDVKASALNFRDIMLGLGRLPIESFAHSWLGKNLGLECSGVVVECGDSVKDYKVGDKVIIMKGGCIANRIQCDEREAFLVPHNMSFEEGSAFLSVYVTAYYSLIHLGRMREGQTVLVHAAMGGVGQAAIALAKLKGANVYGTAGSEEKRNELREMGCLDAFDSRSTEWYPALMDATDGAGVDLVINSLAGEHIDLCLEALKAGGYHFEIGKMDIFSNRPMNMSVFQKNLTFRGVDIDRLMSDDRELSRQLSNECLHLFETGQVPALPMTHFSYGNYLEAIQCMMNGKHSGKLVLVPEKGEIIDVADSRPLYGVGSDGSPRSVLITGGFGGFGLGLLSYVISRGARHVVLFDRDAQLRRSPEWLRNSAHIDYMFGEDLKVDIKTLYADVGKYEDVVEALNKIESLDMPPIGSVFHLAGVTDDKIALDMDIESFDYVYKPKANGAWNLHRATMGMGSIENFVLLSSISSVLGGPGQTNYSAANSYLDGLAAMRRQSNLPALSFGMGAVNGAGMASKNPQILRMMKSRGIPPISFIFAFNALDSELRSSKYSNSVAVLADSSYPALVESTDFLRTAQLVYNSSSFKFEENGSMTKEGLIARLSVRLAELCGVEEVDASEPLSTYGLNSISVAEFLGYLKGDLNYSVSPLELMTSATCESIAEGILDGQKQKNSSTSDEEEAEEAEAEDEISSFQPVTKDMIEKSRFAPSPDEYFEKGSALQRRKVSKAKAVQPTPEAGLKSSGDIADAEGDSFDEYVEMLPPPCQEALEDILIHVHGKDATGIDEAVPVDEIKKVLVTGATGFVGRHFVADLLQQEAIEMVYCPVRGETDDDAYSRLIKAMGEADLWDEAYRERLAVFKCDMQQDDFGASSDLYEELASTTDAVYHFACNISLAASFDVCKTDNCSLMKSVLNFCIATRKKHLFHASTLGIFPQYFCRFGGIMREKAITKSLPDIGIMKTHFPLAVSGYPWSKVVNEIAVQRAAQEKGIPLAIFRMPVMLSNIATGYTVQTDPDVRMFLAFLHTRTCPSGYDDMSMDDCDQVNKIMLRTSLNPNRQHTIYNCLSNLTGFMTECSSVNMMGFNIKSVPFETFKANCLAHGRKSPLQGYWSFVESFKDYWNDDLLPRKKWPIDTDSVVADCPEMPEASSTETFLRKSFQWVLNHEDIWAYDTNWLHPSLDADTLTVPVKGLCAKYNEDFDEVIPPFVLEGFQRIAAELHPELISRPNLANFLTATLENRFQLHRVLKLHPEIEEIPIKDPVFILGLNRTGTTFLHRLLDSSGAFETPHFEDQCNLLQADKLANPAPEDLDDRVTGTKEMSKYFFSDGLVGIHDMDIGMPEEDMCAHIYSYHSLFYDLVHDLPLYREWLDNQPMHEVYQEHKKWMQFIIWFRQKSKKVETPPEQQRWCFKLPWHARSLEALVQVYPDSKIINTHRRPEEVLGSWLSLVESVREFNRYEVDKQKLGEYQMKVVEELLSRVQQFRTDYPEFKEKWTDVRFLDLVSEPNKVALDLLSSLGIRPTPTLVRNIDNFIEEQSKKISERGIRDIDYRDYGLAEEDVESSDIFSLENELYCS